MLLSRLVCSLGLSVLMACGPSGGGCPAPISDAITLGPEWTEIAPPTPLEALKVIQEVHLMFPRQSAVDSASGLSDLATTSIQFVHGSRVTFEGALVDEFGNEFPLGASGIDSGLYLSKKGPIPLGFEGPMFPRDRVYSRVRIKASEKIQVDSISWECRTPH